MDHLVDNCRDISKTLILIKALPLPHSTDGMLREKKKRRQGISLLPLLILVNAVTENEKDTQQLPTPDF